MTEVAVLCANFDRDLGGYRCDLARLPSARILRLMVEGRVIPETSYVVWPQLGVIHWLADPRNAPATVVAVVELTSRLVTLKAALGFGTALAVLMSAFVELLQKTLAP